MNSVRVIFQDGGIYIALYAYFALAMIVEAIYDSEIFSRWTARAGMVMIVLLIGLRWNTGTDWMPYLRVFYTTDSSSDYDSVVFGIDQGYVLLNRIVFYFSDNYSVFLLIDACIAVGAVYVFIEKSTRLPNMGVYLFYTCYVVTHFMGSNRRMLAIGFVCMGFLFLSKERRIWERWPRWAVPFGIAATVHRTSLAGLAGLAVSRRAWPTWAVIIGLLACLGLGVAGLPFSGLEWLGSTLAKYTGISAIDKLVFYTSGEVELGADVNVVLQAALGVAKRSSVLVIFIAYMRFGNPNQYAQRLYNIYIIGCAVYFAMVGSPIFQIISTYYSIVEIVLIPIIFSEMPKLKVPYILYLLAVPLILLITSLVPYIELYVPYRSIFSTF